MFDSEKIKMHMVCILTHDTSFTVYPENHSCSVPTVRTLRSTKSSGTLWNFLLNMELYGTLQILGFVGQSVGIV